MKQRMRRNVLFFLAAGLVIAMAVSNIQTAELAPHLHKTILDNGLTVLVKEVPGSKAATVQIWVKAGSVYEDADEGGITHLIEHMIFKGTPTLGPGELAGAIENVGGRINAYTSYEYTVYHATQSARYWSRAMEVLIDAVLHSTFDADELEREKKVVLEEIRMRKDRPGTRLFEELMDRAYTTHPYRLPIAGTMESVAAFSRDDMLKYIKKHYQPDNVTVVVVGDVQFDQVAGKVTALMGHLPKKGYAPPSLPREPEQKKARFFKLPEDISQTHMAIALPIASFSSPDTPVLDVMAHILGDGETSRLYQHLRNEKQLVYRIHGSAFTPRDAGLMEIFATLEAAHVEEALKGALEEIFKMKYQPVSVEELERAKRNLESDFIFNLEQAEGQARVLGTFEFLSGDPREDAYLEKLRAVSQEDITRVASHYFTNDKVTAGIIMPARADVGLNADSFAALIASADQKARQGAPASLISKAYLSNLHRFVLPNGIRLLVREDPEVATVAVRAVFPGGQRGETKNTSGAFTFISELLPKGTAKLPARELALEVANMAGKLHGFSGKNTFGIKGDFLSRFFEQGMELMADVIKTPAFNAGEAEKIRPELLAQLKHQEDTLPSLAFREFNRLLFQGHPYGLNTAGSETAFKRFTVDELKTIYRRHAKPDQLVLTVSGDVEADKVRALAMSLFGDWTADNTTSGAMTVEEHLPPDLPAAPEIFNIDREKEQVHIIIGFLGATLTGSDRYGLEVLDSVLSGQSGRLFTELRDKHSLAYSLSSFSQLGLDTGSFGIYIGTSPDKKDAAIKAVWQQLFRIRERPISEEELQKAKNVLIGHYELGLQTHGSQAMEIALNETYGLGQDFGNRYIQELGRVDAAKVLEAAQRYIQPDHYVMVTIGAGSTTGKNAAGAPQTGE